MADEIMRELGRLLVEEVQDPRLNLVTVSGVAMNPDLTVARVSLTYDREMHPQAEVEQALTRAKGFLRSRIGKNLKLKRTPDLVFVFDEFLEDMVYDKPHE